MKKITQLIIILLLIVCTNSCAGYKPIFGTTNLQFEIADHLIKGDKKLGNKIYSNLKSLSKQNQKNSNAKIINITIEVSKEKNATTKSSSGKILEYKIILNTKIVVKDFLTNNKILDHNFISSTSYKVQDQFSETKRLENKSIENLINKTYQDLLIKLSGIIA